MQPFSVGGGLGGGVLPRALGIISHATSLSEWRVGGGGSYPGL